MVSLCEGVVNSPGGQGSPPPYCISTACSSCLKSIVMALLMPNDEANLSEPEPDTWQTALCLQAGSATELQTLMW